MNLKNQINQEIKSDECTESKKNQLNQEKKKTSKSIHRSADYLNVFVAHL
jgi:hypothetical protein